jgi:general secretion pathway protein D
MRTTDATDRLTADRYGYMRAQQQGFVSPNIMVRDANTPMLPPADAPTMPFVDPRGSGPVPGPLPLPQTIPQPAQPQPMQQPAPQPLSQQGGTATVAAGQGTGSGRGN